MLITIFASLGCLLFIILIYTLLFSTSDEIPASSKLPERPKSDQVYQPSRVENTPMINSTSSGLQPDKHLSKTTDIKRNRPAIFYENDVLEHHETELKDLHHPKDKYRYAPLFQKLCEWPHLISFHSFLTLTNFGFNPAGRTHYLICTVLYPFLILFRLFLYMVSWIGTLFFNIVIRMIIESMIRLVSWVIRGFIHALFH